MSKGSPVIKVRVREPLRARIMDDIHRLNQLPQHGAMTVSDWLILAIEERLNHAARSRQPRRKASVPAITAAPQCRACQRICPSPCDGCGWCLPCGHAKMCPAVLQEGE
jgi:hypothetical protein